MADDMLGWELLLANTKPDIQKKEDVLLLLIHYKLLRFGFKCAGVGENWSLETKSASEILPQNWSMGKEYVLRYIRDDDKCILMSQHNDNVIIFNIIMSDKLKASNIVFKFDEVVENTSADICTMVPTYKDVMRTIEFQLLTSLAKVQTSHMETQTTETKEKKENIYVHAPYKRPSTENFVPDFRNITEIGRSDLDPLAAMGSSGMLFDPLSQNRNRLLDDLRSAGLPQPLPRGSIPPNARFEPFGPPVENIPGRRGLNPDYDNMFL